MIITDFIYELQRIKATHGDIEVTHPDVTHTWNTVKGRCPHDCEYCYMKIFKLGNLRFDTAELKTNLGKDNFIFVGSSCDMFADTIQPEWISQTLSYCKIFDNRYLFQSKNPHRFMEFYNEFPPHRIFGTTIETNRQYGQMGITRPPEERATELSYLAAQGNKTMVTIEPVMDFDLGELVELIRKANPEWVNLGADSKGHKLPEPTSRKIRYLIETLKRITDVKLKPNLKRLYH